LRFSDVMPNTVAVLGTGRMGDAIAHKLLADGFAVHAWNRTRERAAAVVAAGAVAAHTPLDAVAEADVVVTMLTDNGAVAAVMNDADGGGLAAMTPGCTWIQMGTIGPSWTDELAALATARGVPFVDAPVMGSDDAARAGTLVVLASGPESARGAVAPVFDAVARRTLWLGPAGAGSRLKLAVNNWLACLVEGVAETLALTAALGLDPRLILEATVGGPLAAPFALTKARAMLDGQVSPGFALRDALKDVAMALDVAGAKGVELPLTEALTQRRRRRPPTVSATATSRRSSGSPAISSLMQVPWKGPRCSIRAPTPPTCHAAASLTASPMPTASHMTRVWGGSATAKPSRSSTPRPAASAKAKKSSARPTPRSTSRAVSATSRRARPRPEPPTARPLPTGVGSEGAKIAPGGVNVWLSG
jgi:3-hydroxyisobutyrate dehydrogenase